LPFSFLHLKGPRPRVFPRGYPHDPQTLGELVRRRRMDLGLTQRTLAKKLACLQETVLQWEQDVCVPLARRWPRIEAVLGAGLVPDPPGLAGRIRAARLQLGLTQAELAAKAGVDVRTIRNAERGLRVPSRATLARLRAVAQ
jgi:transcriptional regulator with XRE-family HTH domain